MKLALGILSLLTSAAAFAEPSLNCAVEIDSFTKSGANVESCGTITLSNSKSEYYGVGACKTVAVNLMYDSHGKAWNLYVGTTKGAPSLDETSRIAFPGRPPATFTFEGNTSLGSVQLICATKDWK